MMTGDTLVTFGRPFDDDLATFGRRSGAPESRAERAFCLRLQLGRDLKVLTTVAGERSEETAMHRRFAASLHRNEWFILTSDLIDFIGANRISDKARVREGIEEIRAAYAKVEW